MTSELESKILECYKQGKKNRAIARELSIHHNTVRYWLVKNNLKANYFGQPIEMVGDDLAKCTKCKDIKSIIDFQFGRKGQQYEYRFSFCNECRKKQSYLNLNNDVDKFLADRYNRLKLRAKKNNIDCTITKQEFIEQYKKQNGLCFYTDVKLICEVGSELHRDSLSIDKIIPEKGYIFGNIVFTTHRINTCKCDLSLDEIKQWMPGWYQRINNFMKKIQEQWQIDAQEILDQDPYKIHGSPGDNHYEPVTHIYDDKDIKYAIKKGDCKLAWEEIRELPPIIDKYPDRALKEWLLRKIEIFLDNYRD